MALNVDVKASTITGTGTVKSGPARIKGLNYVCNATGGSIVLRDGGASGTIVLNVAAPPVAGAYEVNIPEDGIRCGTDIHATLTNVTSLTTFYSG